MAGTQFKVENYIANSFVMVEGKKNENNFYIYQKRFHSQPDCIQSFYELSVFLKENRRR